MRQDKTLRGVSTAAVAGALFAAALLSQACAGGPRGVLLNERATTLGSHNMIIQPVGKWHSNSFAGPQQDTDGKQMWVFSVDETKIAVKDERLSVNGKDYGKLNPGDSVAVRYAKVYVNGKEVSEGGALASR
jgi:hypothetical protein